MKEVAIQLREDTYPTVAKWYQMPDEYHDKMLKLIAAVLTHKDTELPADISMLKIGIQLSELRTEPLEEYVKGAIKDENTGTTTD